MLRPTKRGLASGLLLAAVLVEGCALVLGIEDVPESAAVPDGGDANQTMDSSTVRDSSDTDTSSDSEAEATAPTFCDGVTPKPTFCADFDKPNSLFGWTSRTNNSGGTLLVDSVFTRSPPGSLWTASPSLEAGATQQSLLKQTFAVQPSTAKLAFDLRVLARDPARLTTLTYLEVGRTPANYTIALMLTPTGEASIRETFPANDAGQRPNITTPLPFVPGTTDWAHIEIDIRYTQPGAALNLAIGGISILKDIPLTPEITSPVTSLYFGLNYVYGPASPVDIRGDNVVLYLN